MVTAETAGTQTRSPGTRGVHPQGKTRGIDFSAVGFPRRVLRAVRLLARDDRIPQPLRWLAALGLAPIPGPFDEAVLLIVAVLLWVFYRDRLGEAWQRARA